MTEIEAFQEARHNSYVEQNTHYQIRRGNEWASCWSNAFGNRAADGWEFVEAYTNGTHLPAKFLSKALT